MNTVHGLHRLTLWTPGGFEVHKVTRTDWVTVTVPKNGQLPYVLSDEQQHNFMLRDFKQDWMMISTDSGNRNCLIRCLWCYCKWR